MATRDRQNYALQTIFSFFLGLIVLAFIGIGVNTFYESPTTDQAVQDELDSLYRQQGNLSPKAGTTELTPQQQSEEKRVQDRINEINKEQETIREGWARNTSIVLIAFATLVMGISLVRSEQLRVISNGLLLGGLFTTIYGVGWVLFSGQSVARFVVVVFAFAISIGLGYVKFVRERAGAAMAPAGAVVLAGGPLPEGAVAELAARVDALEARAAAAAAALGAPRDALGKDYPSTRD
ncbi:MAG: hypothetical protein Q8K99_01150 [Actinomycetota bacterium]|nr:hypothetical protein [Actinomycetota bacterium]